MVISTMSFALSNQCMPWKISALPKYFFLTHKHAVILRAYFLFESWIMHISGLATVFWIMNKQLRDTVYICHTQSTVMVWDLCYFLQIFQLDLIYFLSLSWGETRDYVLWCISVWFLLSLNGVYISKLAATDKLCENGLFPYVNLTLFFSLLMVSHFFPPKPSKSRTVFPNSQAPTHCPKSISQPELCKVRHREEFPVLLEHNRKKSCCAVILNSCVFPLLKSIDVCRINFSEKVVSPLHYC